MEGLREFIELLRQHSDKMSYDEIVEKESVRVIVKCGDKKVLEHLVIKCECESIDQIRQYVYERVLHALYNKGILEINKICAD
jgi:hypothetical protein